ncbi:mechanosensitive ion channel family protein [Roseiconus lacunae]|uniref:mechanosensitive ion channel domain-containing protein n=1 Tax=Roseiconus lacunae TaxID=2605694 RepID=UPI00308C41E7|nr:mechanosensitive ion channel family protein [Stieleria sp. HD01]
MDRCFPILSRFAFVFWIASRRWWIPVGCLSIFAVSIAPLSAQDVVADPSGEREPASVTDEGDSESSEEVDVQVADEVNVEPVNSDERIESRLQEIFEATGWFVNPQVNVDRGVAFLEGVADNKTHLGWAEATAMKTSDVVAVVNQIKVAQPPLWNFLPAVRSLRQLGQESIEALPLVLIAIFIGVISYYSARGSARAARYLARNRIDSTLLRQVFGNVIGVLLFIVGVYVALRVSGLTRLAVTLLGGTGLVGLALGFAFRDIAENYLASILISLNHPFRVGDLIEVEGAKGFVRKVTTRGTILNTLDGNQIQMPNSTVYKGKITNFTATPLSRRDFLVGIGFDDPIAEAQEIVMDVLANHVAVVDDPAPIVIVESLGSATINLRVYYWFNQAERSPLKVSSSVIRLVKQRLTDAKITMPDEARELVFPQGVPVQMLDHKSNAALTERKMDRSSPTPKSKGSPSGAPTEPSQSVGEGDLRNEQEEVMRATEDDAIVADEANLIG